MVAESSPGFFGLRPQNDVGVRGVAGKTIATAGGRSRVRTDGPGAPGRNQELLERECRSLRSLRLAGMTKGWDVGVSGWHRGPAQAELGRGTRFGQGDCGWGLRWIG